MDDTCRRNYAVTVTATDSKTALSGKAVYNITIAAAKAPVVTGGTISAKAGTPLSFSVVLTAANPVTYSLSGAPAGMAVSTSGVVSWAAPVVGTYNVTAIAKDTKPDSAVRRFTPLLYRQRPSVVL
jgi:hypothetical protein